MSDKAASISSSAATIETDEGYIVLENTIAERVASNRLPLFTTTVTPEALWNAYLGGIDETHRKHYDCHCCRRFIQTYGGLVTIDSEGTIRSLCWQGDEEVPPFFEKSVRALVGLIAGAKVTGVFLTSDNQWGTPSNDDKKRTGTTWSHLHGRPWTVYRSVLSASQAMAEKLEDFKMLKRALADYGPKVAAEAVRVLKADALSRSEKTLGIAEWFADLHGKDDKQLWLAVATAPPGFCHVRSTMIATLLDDILAGLDFDSISKRWAEKMHPLQYQRPTAAPKEGTIEAAEKLVAKLGIEKSLLRRFAKLTDVQTKIWEPKAEVAKKKSKSDGVFSELRGGRSGKSDVKSVDLPATTMTWDKFQRTVLPGARSLEVLAPSHGNYYALVTAADPDAPPILQWDRLEKRNPVSMYVYVHGSPAASWGLSGGSWTKVNCVFPSPEHWNGNESKHFPEGAYFALEGARESRSASLALFPETLKSELHGIRSVVEAYSNKGSVSGKEDGDANGIVFTKGSGIFSSLKVRVNGSELYTIDRWD